MSVSVCVYMCAYNCVEHQLPICLHLIVDLKTICFTKTKTSGEKATQTGAENLFEIDFATNRASHRITSHITWNALKRNNQEKNELKKQRDTIKSRKESRDRREKNKNNNSTDDDDESTAAEK